MQTDWSFNEMERFITDRGDLVVHETGVACTCSMEDLFAANIGVGNKPVKVRALSCPLCNGDGFIYRNPRCVKGLITSIQSGSNRQLIENGWAVPGDCVFSPPPSYMPSVTDFDRITFTVVAPVNEGQVIVRNAANMQENVVVTTDLQENEDRLWYLAECALHCEDSNGTQYYQNTDFVFDGKKIRWVGNRPKNGQPYVVKYLAFLEWVAWATPMTRIDNGRYLGPRVMLRKKHVWFSKDVLDTPADRKDAYREFTTRVSA